MSTNYERTARFFDYWTGKAERLLKASGTVFADGRVLYSYGRHFPLAVAIGERGTDSLWFLLNGDTYSVSTNRHQSDARGLANGTGRRTMIVPFSALRSAGIYDSRNLADLGSIVPIHIRADTTIERERASRNIKDVPMYRREVWDAAASVNRDVQPDPDGFFRWTESEHQLGAALFRATVSLSVPVSVIPGAPIRSTYRDMVSAKAEYTAEFLSSFDSQENRPHYFLCELPDRWGGGEDSTVENALESLKPERVRRAETAGIAVFRQGDVFAIATTFKRADLVSSSTAFGKRTDRPVPLVMGTNHSATETACLVDSLNGTETWYARGCLYHYGSAPIHGRVKLGDGKTWYMLEKNRVPVSIDHRANGNGFAGTVRSRAWSASGRID